MIYLKNSKSDNLNKEVAFEIFPHTTTKFFGKILQVNIEFIPDLEGKTTTLTFRQGGMEFVCNRVDNSIRSLSIT